MKRLLTWFSLSFILSVSTSLFIVTGCSTNRITKEETEAEENDKYDGPGKAIEFEIERTKDPATGKVPWNKLWPAIHQTELSKQAGRNSPNNITTLSWIERGSNGDIAGPQGNSRPNNDQTGGRIRAAMVDSLDGTHKTVWVGGVDGGLWKTTDITASPANWTLINDQFTNLAVSAICQDPRPAFQTTMYFCTGESFSNADAVRGVGVFKSTDGGATWNFLNSTNTYTSCTRILCDYQGNVYLGVRNVGLLRSLDGGSTWVNITPAGIGSSVCDLEISSTAVAGRLHVATGIFSTSGYAYTDNPSAATPTWNSPTTPFTTFNQRTEMAISGNNLIAAPCNGSYQVPTIWKSTDGGNNWVSTISQPSASWASGQGWYAISAAFNPADPNQFIVGGLDTWKTTDGGNSWIHLSTWVGVSGQYVHADQHNIQWWDGGNKLMFTCDGGVHYSSDGGNTIRDRNRGLRLKQFYSVAIHPQETNYFLAGAQDNGVHRLNHPGLDSSVEVYGGDGCYVAIDQGQPQYQFGSYVYNVYRRTTNNGASWSTPINNQGTGRFVNPWDYDNTNKKIYACNQAGNYLRWDDPQTGATTTVVTVPEFGSGNVSAVYVSPFTANRVFFGTGIGGVFKVDNANTASPTTTTITPAGSSGYVNCIVAGTTEQDLLVCFSNYGINNVWVTTDGGNTWAGIDGNLPDMPVRWALFHPDGDTKAYIATETGVWETTQINGASTVWTANSSFPNVRTDMIKYRASDRTIAAGTHGRGVWSATVPAAAGFSFNTPAPATTTCPAPASMSITLTTVSNGGFVSPITLSAIAGVPAGTNVTFNPNPVIPGNSSIVTLNNTNTLGAGSYVITIQGVATGATTQTVNLTYTINPGPGPAITVQPNNQTVCAGSNATFSITSSSATSFQWQVSTDGGVTWNNIGGATLSSYTVNGATAGQNGYQYRCVAATICGSTNSNPATLTVGSPPNITTQPADVTICSGNSTQLCVTVSANPGLTYQWQSSATCAGPWTNIGGGTSSCLTVSPVVTTSYRCAITSTICGVTINSNCATVTVSPVITITSNPANQTVCEGSNASFSVTASGTGLSYQWQLSTDGGATYNNIAGATSSSYTATSVTASMNGYRYRCVVTSTCGTNATSTAAILTVNTLPAISGQPAATTVCAGSNASFTVTATGTGISYQWQLSTDGGSTWNNIGGATSATYTALNVTFSQTGYQYRCVVSGTCTPAATSSAAILTVITSPNVSVQPASTAVCSGSNAIFSVTASSPQSITYQWQLSTDGGVTWNNIPGATSSGYTVIGATLAMNNYRYRCLLSNFTCSVPAPTNAAVLTVNALPVVTWNNVLSDLCSNTTSYTLSGGSPAGGVYSGAGVSGTNFNAVNAGGANTYTLTYTYTNANGCVNSATNTIKVRQQPTIGLTASKTALLPGQLALLTATPSASTGGTLTSSWLYNSSPLNISGNTYSADVEHIGTYQALVQESWPGGLVCANSSPVITITALASGKLFIFPSPNDGNFIVSYYNESGGSTQRRLIIYDNKGSQVFDQKFTVSGPYTLMHVNLQNANTGIYFVIVGDATGNKLADGKVHVR